MGSAPGRIPSLGVGRVSVRIRIPTHLLHRARAGPLRLLNLRDTVCDMDEDQYRETQWTAEAKQAYERRAEDLVEALRAHVKANLTRSGRQKEFKAYFESGEALLDATREFNEAEFDWCGSFPLALRPDEDDDDDDEDEEWEDQDESGSILSVVGRWDFRITDEPAAIASGRNAYLRAWPDDINEDAEARVQLIGDAAAELMHADGLRGLEDADGMSLERNVTSFFVHEGEDDEAFNTDPFAITREE